MNAFPFFRSPRCALTALLTFGLGFQAHSQSVTTTPVGAMVYSFPATTPAVTTYISIPLTNASVYSGPVASFTANTITFSGTPFTAGGLSQVGSPFFARVASGAQSGRIMLVTANTASSVTVDSTDNYSSSPTTLDTIGWSVSAGDRIEIIVGDTLATLLGDNTGGNPLLLVGTSSAFTADTIGIYNKNTSKFDVYYFNTSSGFWRLSSGTANANSVVIYPEASIQINRRAGRSAASMTIVGDVPTAALRTKLVGSNSIYASPRYPIDVTLAQLSLSGWTKSNSAFTADTVSIYNVATSRMETFFQRLDNSWRKSGDTSTDQSSFVVPAGSGIVLLKRSAVTGANSLVATSLPYTL